MSMPVCQSPGTNRTQSKTSRINSANSLFSSKDSVQSAAKAENTSVFLHVVLECGHGMNKRRTSTAYQSASGKTLLGVP